MGTENTDKGQPEGRAGKIPLQQLVGLPAPEISFKPTHKLFLLGSRMPVASASDGQLFRRLHSVQFTGNFEKEKVTAENLKDMVGV